MPQISNISPMPTGHDIRSMTLNLTLDGPDIVLIRSCEVLGPEFRSRFSFSEHRRLDDVLVGRLAHAISLSLHKIPPGAHVLALPEFLIELPGLVLSGAHILVMEASNRVRSVIVRFKHVIGAANRALKVDVGVEAQPVTHGQRLAVNVLADICLPLLNICHEMENTLRTTGQMGTTGLMEQVREFRFQTELLKRFITSADQTGDADALPLPEAGGLRTDPSLARNRLAGD